MRKINWINIRNVIFYLCFAVFVVMGLWPSVMFSIYVDCKCEPAQSFVFIGMGITILSLVIGCATLIIDYVREHKKCKKLEYVQQRVIIEEDVVV